jgi:iron-sulfur cluster repair protein YtfE (RIC family)
MAENLYEMLKDDHTKVKDLLEKTIEEKSAKKFPQIKKELEVHMEGEEEYFYPDLKKDDAVTIIEGYYEHSLAKKVINDIEDEKKENDEWLARVKVLQDLIKHHIEEEEDEIFKLAKEKLNKKKEDEIYKKFKDLKKKNDLM